MEYYFDFEFLLNLLEHSSDEDVLDDFVRRFLKEIHGRTIVLVLPENQSSILDNPILRRLIDAGCSLESLDNVKASLDDPNATPFRFYFSNLISETAIRTDYGYFAINTKSFDKIWKTLSSFSESVDKTFGNEVKSWSDLKEYNFLPINFIAFTDRYFFGRRNAIQDNFFPLFQTLKVKKLQKRKVDILIIGNQFTIENATNKHLEEVFETLSNFFDSTIGPESYNLSLIKVDSKTNPKDTVFHARTLITNNLFLKPGKGFDQFENGLIKKETESITIRMFVRPKAYASCRPFFLDIKNAFEKVHDVFGDSLSGKRRLSKNEPVHSLVRHSNAL
jgi:hypothetical protein